MTASTLSQRVHRLGRIAVLMGGRSAEREISLRSGQAVLQALLGIGADVFALDPAEQSLNQLQEGKVARIFIALHGRGGEDGSIQGALEHIGIPYTGSGVMASAIAMDKWRTKLIWHAANIPTPASVLLTADSNYAKIIKDLGLPLFVKPAREGSSLGASRVNAINELEAAHQHAARYDDIVLVERFIQGQELTCAFLGDRALPIVRIEAPEGRYDYTNKYFSNDTQYHCPSGLSPQLEHHIQALVLQAAKLLNCRGWGRADIILDNQDPYLLEINTSPGMTDHSLVPLAARTAGIDFAELIVQILEMARVEQPA